MESFSGKTYKFGKEKIAMFETKTLQILKRLTKTKMFMRF